MKKRMKKSIKKEKKKNKLLKNKVFLVSIIVLGLVILGLLFVFYKGTTEKAVGNGSLASTSFPTNQQVMDGIKSFFLEYFGFLGNTLTEIFISLIIALIIFAAVYDMLELTSIFQNDWTQRLIAIGVTVIAVILQWPIIITRWGLDFAAYLGAIGIFLEIVIAIVIFIGLMFGNTWLAKFAVKRKGQVEELKALKGAGRAGAAIQALKKLDTDFRSP